MTALEILLKKSKRLKSIPDKFLSKIELVQKEQFNLITKIMSSLAKTGETISPISANFKIIDSLREQLQKDLLTGDYQQAVKELIGEMDVQKGLSNDYFEKTTDEKFSDELATELHDNIKESTAKKLIENEPATKYITPLEEKLNAAVGSNARYDDTLKMVRDFIEGEGKESGVLMRYAQTIAHDSFTEGDRAYGNAIADDLELEFYFYAGDEILTTRCFCSERYGKYYHYKEIEAWGRGEDLADCGFPWNGMKDGTDESTIFIYAGGHNCNHSIAGVSIFDVPMDVIQRNIESGNYEPDEAERELLGI